MSVLDCVTETFDDTGEHEEEGLGSLEELGTEVSGEGRGMPILSKGESSEGGDAYPSDLLSFLLQNSRESRKVEEQEEDEDEGEDEGEEGGEEKGGGKVDAMSFLIGGSAESRASTRSSVGPLPTLPAPAVQPKHEKKEKEKKERKSKKQTDLSQKFIDLTCQTRGRLRSLRDVCIYLWRENGEGSSLENSRMKNFEKKRKEKKLFDWAPNNKKKKKNSQNNENNFFLYISSFTVVGNPLLLAQRILGK